MTKSPNRPSKKGKQIEMNRNVVIGILVSMCWMALDHRTLWSQPYALVPHTTAQLRVVPHQGHFHLVPQLSTHFHLVPNCQWGGCYGSQSLGAGNGPRRLRPYRYSFDSSNSRTLGPTKESVSSQALGLQRAPREDSLPLEEPIEESPVRYLISKQLTYRGSGVRIRMPDTLDDKVTLVIDNGSTLSIRGGQEKHLKDRGAFLVRFSRGQTDDGTDAGEAQLSVFEGVYWIIPTELGLDLVRQEEIEFAGASIPNQAGSSKVPARSLASRLLDPIRTLPIPLDTNPKQQHAHRRSVVVNDEDNGSTKSGPAMLVSQEWNRPSSN
jgi:hypothetical protein